MNCVSVHSSPGKCCQVYNQSLTCWLGLTARKSQRDWNPCLSKRVLGDARTLVCFVLLCHCLLAEGPHSSQATPTEPQSGFFPWCGPWPPWMYLNNPSGFQGMQNKPNCRTPNFFCTNYTLMRSLGAGLFWQGVVLTSPFRKLLWTKVWYFRQLAFSTIRYYNRRGMLSHKPVI